MAAEQGRRSRTSRPAAKHGGTNRRSARFNRSQTVYRGPVVYVDDPVRRLEAASSDLELLLLLVFLKDAVFRTQREYLFVMWTEEEPEEEWVDLAVSPGLIDAMQGLGQQPIGSRFQSAGPDSGCASASKRCPPSPCPTTRSPPRGSTRSGGCRANCARRPRPLPRSTLCRNAVAKVDAASRRDGAAAAWHAESIVRFLCSALGDCFGGLWVSDDNLIWDHRYTAGPRHRGGPHRRRTGGQLRMQDQRR